MDAGSGKFLFLIISMQPEHQEKEVVYYGKSVSDNGFLFRRAACGGSIAAHSARTGRVT